jgi:hypothetical protein
MRSGAGTVCGQGCLFFFFTLFPERVRFKGTFRIAASHLWLSDHGSYVN